jgi:hypothetical protein
MSKNEQLERQMAGPLAAALVTVATFCLTVMGLVNSPGQNFIDEIFMILGLASLLSAARIIDATFDRVALNVTDRLKLIGGGYFLFCLIVGGMSFAILLLYATKSVGASIPWIALLPAHDVVVHHRDANVSSRQRSVVCRNSSWIYLVRPNRLCSLVSV